MNNFKKSVGNIVVNIITIFISLIILIPILVLFLNSFKTQGESNKMSLSLPTKWMFENYKTVIEQGKLVSSFFNSLLYATASVSIIIVVVSAAAFVIARNRKVINNFIYYFIISGIAIPINNVALMKVM